MLKRHFFLNTLLIITIILTGCTQQHSADDRTTLTVSAAISLSDVLTELKALYEETNENVAITYNFGGSGTLSQQIQQGAPVDIFISANEQWMDTLAAEQLLVEDTLTTITANELVLIGGAGLHPSEQTIEHYLMQNEKTIAIGHPDTVPAGKYTHQALNKLNLSSGLKDELIFAKDVRQVLTYVETGNADLGFVYKSDALTSEKSEILVTVDSDLHDPITYPSAVIGNTAIEKEARAFLEFLTRETAESIFTNYGFSKQ